MPNAVSIHPIYHNTKLQVATYGVILLTTWWRVNNVWHRQVAFISDIHCVQHCVSHRIRET